MRPRHHCIEYRLDNRSSFSHIDSISSLGHAVLESMTIKVTAPFVFAADIAIKSLKIVSQEIHK